MEHRYIQYESYTTVLKYIEYLTNSMVNTSSIVKLVQVDTMNRVRALNPACATRREAMQALMTSALAWSCAGQRKVPTV